MTPLFGFMLGAVGFALINKILKGNIWPAANSTKMGPESKDKIIEIDDYEILE